MPSKSNEARYTYHGGCFCNAIQWKVSLNSPSDARTSLCHCRNCKKLTGSAFGVTTKVPWDAYSLLPGSQSPSKHVAADNGSASRLSREFCGICGSGVREWGEKAEGKSTYVCYGGLEEKGRQELAPKGEFFCSLRESWQQDISGEKVFRKEEIDR